jgi:2Fe-2S ferredoxin
MFKDKDRSVEVGRWTSVLDAALEHKIPLYHTCGGNASCSTCRVLVLKGAKNLSEIESAEAQVLDAFDLKPPHRLGCQAQVLKGEIEVEIPKRTKAPRPNKTPPLPR